MKKPTVRDCSGCYNDIYNHSNMGPNMTDKGPRCWSLADAKFVKAYDIHLDQSPPYKGIKLTSKPNCYRKQRYCRVLPERINKLGYWK